MQGLLNLVIDITLSSNFNFFIFFFYVFFNIFLFKKGLKKTVNSHFDDSLIETKLHEQTNTQFYAYTKVQWSLHMRKEVGLNKKY